MKTKLTVHSLTPGGIALWLWLMALHPQTTFGQHGHGDPGGGDTNPCPATAVLPPAPFRDPLPIPPTAVPARTNYNYCITVLTNICLTNGIPEYDMPMTSFLHSFHSDLPPVPVWGYAGSYPGPTIECITNAPVLVNWINHLPTNYPPWLPADTNLHDVGDQRVRTVVHLHGAASMPRYDGYPTNTWFSGETDQYFYGNIDFSQDGQTLWYHDHAIGVTANNVYAGLSGFYWVRSPGYEAALGLKLPRGKYEVPLVIQDKDLQTNCPPATLMLGSLPWHSLAVVNGKVTPYFQVEPRRYRFRILNAAGFRTFGLRLAVTDTNGIPLVPTVPPPPFYVIGNEDGFLQQTVTNLDIKMMPAERVEILIDFSKHTNRNLTLYSTLGNADVPSPPYITNLMQFRVTLPLESPDESVVPTVLSTNWISTATMVSQAVTNRQVTVDLTFETPFPGPPFSMNSGYPFALLNMMYFDEPITDFPHAGDIEIWSLINLSPEAHPIHIHLLDFRVVDRTRLGSAGGTNWNGNLSAPPLMVTNYINDRINGTLKPLAYYVSTNANDYQEAKPYESGPKDTLHAAPFSVTRLVMKWPTNEIFYTTPSAVSLDPATDGRYIFHCHILDHEDNDMMRPLQLLPPYQPFLQIFRDPAANPGGNNHIRLGLTTRTNETYRLETSANLTTGIWTPLPGGDITGTGGPVVVVPPSSTNQVRFYRATRPGP